MSSLDFDLDSRMNNLEQEWRQAYESSIVARTDYQSLVAIPKTDSRLLDLARERLSELEALRDALGEELEILDTREGTVLAASRERVRSAA